MGTAMQQKVAVTSVTDVAKIEIVKTVFLSCHHRGALRRGNSSVFGSISLSETLNDDIEDALVSSLLVPSLCSLRLESKRS